MNTVTQEQVDSLIVAKEVRTEEMVGKLHTIVAVKLVNGFTIVDTSTCVDERNYKESIGAEVCLARIKNKIWMLEGYLLQNILSQAK